MPARHIEYLRVDQIVPAATNPKKHALDGIGESIARFGYTEPVVMDERTGRLIAGHGRIESLAARHARGEAAPEGIEVDGDGAHMTHRRAALIELSPHYCDVIAARFQAFTNVVPILESTGEPHDFLSEQPAP